MTRLRPVAAPPAPNGVTIPTVRRIARVDRTHRYRMPVLGGEQLECLERRPRLYGFSRDGGASHIHFRISDRNSVNLRRSVAPRRIPSRCYSDAWIARSATSPRP